MAYDDDLLDIFGQNAPPPDQALSGASNFDLGQALGFSPGSIPAPSPSLAGAGASSFDLGQALGYGAPAPTPAPMPQPQAFQGPIGQAPGLDIAPMTGPGPMPALPAIPTAAAPKPGKPLTPLQAIQAREQDAYQQSMAGIQATAAAKTHEAQVSGQGQLDAAQQMAKRQADDAAVNAAANKEITERQTKFRAELETLSNTKIDPNHLVNSMPAWQKIVSVIGLGLGGAYSARTGRANPALAIIQDQINKDIQTQMANLDTKKGALNAKGTMLQQDIANGRDAADARAKATSALYDSAIRETKAQATLLGGETAQAESQELIGGLEAKKADAEHSHWLQEHQLAVSDGTLSLARDNAKFEHGLQLGQFTRGLNNDVTEAAQKANAAALKSNAGIAGLSPTEARKLEVHGADGRLLGYANDDTTAREARKQIGTYEDVRKDLVDYKAAAEKYGREFSAGSWSTDAMKDMTAKHTRLMTTVKEVEKLGVLSGDDLKLLEGQIPGPQGWLGGSPLPALNEAIAHGDQAIDRYMKINVPGAGRYSPPGAADVLKLGGQTGATIPGTAPSGRPGVQGLPPTTQMVWPPPEWGVVNGR